MSVLYIVSTPIGNLGDITLRALDILKKVDFILCEDTRVTQKLLQHYNITTPTLSYHQHSKLKKIEYIVQLLKEGKNLALVSDAGTPGISDPGNALINNLTMKQFNNLTIIPIPGPSALTAAASISGFPMDKFLFMGFPPHKKKRKKFFEEVVNSKYPVIFYESPHRVLRTLRQLKETMQPRTIPLKRELRGRQVNKEARLMVCRELTKKFETIYRGSIEEVIQKIQKDELRGEFVVIVSSK